MEDTTYLTYITEKKLLALTFSLVDTEIFRSSEESVLPDKQEKTKSMI